MGKKKARVRSGIPKFQAQKDTNQDRSLMRAGYRRLDKPLPCDPDEELMLCIGADDFKYDYTEDGICVLTTWRCIEKCMYHLRETDKAVGQVRIRRENGLVIREVKGDPKWFLSLAKMKKFIESYTPEQLWDMREGPQWQEWIDTLTHYYFLKAHVEKGTVAVCEPMKSMKGLNFKEGDCVISQSVNFDESTESIVPTHLQ